MVEPAVETLRGQGPLGWSSASHPGAVVVPYLLVAGSIAAVPPEDLLLSDVFDMINTASWNKGVPDKGAWLVADESDVVAPLATASADPTDGLLLSSLLGDRLAHVSPPADDRARWLRIGRDLVTQRVDAIVTAKHRSAYQRAALPAGGCAEAIDLADGPGAGAAFVTEIRNRFPRHVAFRSELDRLLKSSPAAAQPATLDPPPVTRKRSCGPTAHGMTRR